MKTNARGVDLIKRCEGLRLDAYPDPGTGGAPWTIGYGHTGDVQPGMRITEHQADVILDLDLERFEKNVAGLCPGATPNQFSALVSFVFNLGAGHLERSTLRSRFLAGDHQGAADEFLKWTRAAGKVLPGLVTRRQAERALFLSGAS